MKILSLILTGLILAGCGNSIPVSGQACLGQVVTVAVTDMSGAGQACPSALGTWTLIRVELDQNGNQVNANAYCNIAGSSLPKSQSDFDTSYATVGYTSNENFLSSQGCEFGSVKKTTDGHTFNFYYSPNL